MTNILSFLYKGLWWVLLVAELAGIGVLAIMTLTTASWWGHLIFILAAVLIIGLTQPIAMVPIRAAARLAARSWPDLARATGMTYEPDDRLLWGDRYPAIQGEYRGRLMMIGFPRAGNTYSISSLEVNTPADVPRFLLAIKNPANIRFSIQPKGIFVRAPRIEAVANGDVDFKTLFVVKGEPENYVKRAVELTVAGGTRMLDGLHRNVSTIELNGSYLVWAQGRTLTIEDQIALFNLMYDLAGLAEGMGSDPASSYARRN